MNILMISLAVLMTVISLVLYGKTSGITHYFYLLWLLLGFIRGIVYWKYIWLALNGLPVLIVDKEGVADKARDIKYYWPDITDMWEENLFLYIKVKTPDAYSRQVKNPLNRLLVALNAPNYRINLDMVKCDPEVLIDLIEEANPANKTQ